MGVRAVAVAALLLGLELGLKHVGGFGWWTATERSERYGWRMLPGQDARSRDLTITESINSLGFRDREWDPPLADGSGGHLADERLYRVAVVGNSFTFGTSVEVELTYARVLERMLQEELDRRGDPRRALVMNFSVQGYCLEQMARVYEDVIRPFRPDVLVVPFHPHDPYPMQPASDPPEYDFRRFVVRSATYDLLSRYVTNRWIPAPPPPAAGPAVDGGTPTAPIDWVQLDKDMMERPFAKEFRPLWDAAGERMDGLRRQLLADGGRLVIATVPREHKYFRPEILDASSYWGPWTASRESPVPLVVPWPAFEQAMRPVVEEIQAKGLAAGTTHDLSTLTWTAADGSQRPGTELETASLSLHLLDDMGHLTARGHEVMAQEIFRQGFVAGGLLP